MPTVSEDLDRVQKKLHDSGAIWPRPELLRWYQDGYREFLARSQAVRRLRPLDLPGRHTYAILHEWEDRYAGRGTVRQPSRAARAASMQVMGLWEIEASVGLTSTAALANFTHEWERAFVATDRHLQITFPRNHERITRLAWKERRLAPVSVRELDNTDDAWEQRGGDPRWWTTGVGRVRSVEIYEIRTDYQQAYALTDADAGIPRTFTGDRTWAVARLDTAPANAFAYLTSGDAQALTIKGVEFAPQWAYTQLWERAEVTGTSWEFVIDYTMNEPGLTFTVIHPWEFGLVSQPHPSIVDDAATPGKRGMFAWEHHDPDGGYASRVATGDPPIVLSGGGVRISTRAAALSYFGTQPWEADQVDGVTLRAGQVTGCFSWEPAFGAVVLVFGLGAIRHLRSDAFQYLAQDEDQASVSGLLGRIVDWRSSTDSLVATEVVLPVRDLQETETPQLLPGPLQKYLRFFVLSVAFARPGEGRQPVLADHYGRRFQRGIQLFHRFADVAHRDRVFQREMVTPALRRIARVSLPSEFPAVW